MRLVDQTEQWKAHHKVANQTEILVVYHEEDVPFRELVSTLDACLEPGWQASIRCIASPTGDYYQLKNLGADEAKGEIILFLDSDVLPDPNWLSELLECFAAPEIQVVCGASYLESRSLIEKTLALTWFFPLKPETDGMQPIDHFFANNLAFRRAVILENPFPDLSGTSRGSCIELAGSLRSKGIPIHQNLAARVCHPAPRSLLHVFRRAVAEGRDRLLVNRIQSSRKAMLRNSLRRTVVWSQRSIRSIFRNRHAVSLSVQLLPGAIGLAVSYQLAMLIGDLLTRAFPGMMSSHFRI